MKKFILALLLGFRQCFKRKILSGTVTDLKPTIKGVSVYASGCIKGLQQMKTENILFNLPQ
jgi:hypothetical protein